MSGRKLFLFYWSSFYNELQDSATAPCLALLRVLIHASNWLKLGSAGSLRHCQIWRYCPWKQHPTFHFQWFSSYLNLKSCFAGPIIVSKGKACSGMPALRFIFVDTPSFDLEPLTYLRTGSTNALRHPLESIWLDAVVLAASKVTFSACFISHNSKLEWVPASVPLYCFTLRVSSYLKKKRTILLLNQQHSMEAPILLLQLPVHQKYKKRDGIYFNSAPTKGDSTSIPLTPLHGHHDQCAMCTRLGQKADPPTAFHRKDHSASHF